MSHTSHEWVREISQGRETMYYFWSFEEAKNWCATHAEGPTGYYVYPNRAIGVYWPKEWEYIQ